MRVGRFNMYLFQVYSLNTKLSGVQSTSVGGLLGRTKVDRNVRARCDRGAGSSLSHEIKGVKILHIIITKSHIY